MIEAIDIFLKAVGVFFIIYLIGYSTFLFLSVLVGSSELYKTHRRKCLKIFFRTIILCRLPLWFLLITKK